MTKNIDRFEPDDVGSGPAAPDDGKAINVAREDVSLADDAVVSRALSLLDDEEWKYFALKVQGLQRARIGETLGWNSVKVERVRRRLNLHLAKLRCTPISLPKVSGELLDEAIVDVAIVVDDAGGVETHHAGSGDSDGAEHDGDGVTRVVSPSQIYSFRTGCSLNPFFLQRLPNGFRTWALSPSFERNFPAFPISEGPKMNLQDQLKTEKQLYDRVGERLHGLRVTIETVERELSAAIAAHEKAAAESVLAEVVLPVGREIEKLRATLQSKKGELAAVLAAHKLQAGKLQALEDEIQSQHHAAFLAATHKQRAEIRNAVLDLAEKIFSYRTTAFEYGAMTTWKGDLFPVADRNTAPHPIENLAFNAAMSLLAIKTTPAYWTPDSVPAVIKKLRAS